MKVATFTVHIGRQNLRENAIIIYLLFIYCAHKQQMHNGASGTHDCLNSWVFSRLITMVLNARSEIHVGANVMQFNSIQFYFLNKQTNQYNK